MPRRPLPLRPCPAVRRRCLPPARDPRATRVESTPGGREWVIALDPVTRRFRIDFPDCGGVPDSVERWLMASIAMHLDTPEFSAGVIAMAITRKRQARPYH